MARGGAGTANTRQPAVRCANCGRDIYGGGETKYTDGWIHDRTNAERCDRSKEPTRDNLATPARWY